MSKYVTEVKIQRPDFLGGNEWELKNLNEITVLFGKNGSGKSIMLRKWRDTDVDDCHYIIPERIGTLAFEARFIDHQINPQTRRSNSSTNYSESYRQQVVSRIQAYFMTRGATRENTVKGNPADLEELIKFLLPDFSITFQATNPPYKIERLANNQPVSEIGTLSSGEAQILTMAIDILTIVGIWDVSNKGKKILLIDEPDAHLHPDLQVRFADFIVKVMEKYNVQIVISTHSTTLLSALGQFAKQKCSVIYTAKSTTLFTASVFTDNLKELSACLGGHVLMGPLFAAPLFVVEGDDDYRIWSQVPRHEKVNLAVLPANGEEIKKYQRLLEKIFASISEPRVLGHALLDGDKTLPASNPDNPQVYIPFIKLNCHESENLFLTDEVLSDLGLTWESAKAKILQEAANFGNKQSDLILITKSDRRIVDLKNVINELSKILDSKNVHWTTRVGNRIGKEKPTGMLSDFLGDQVVNALWPSQTPTENLSEQSVTADTRLDTKILQ